MHEVAATRNKRNGIKATSHNKALTSFNELEVAVKIPSAARNE